MRAPAEPEAAAPPPADAAPSVPPPSPPPTAATSDAPAPERRRLPGRRRRAGGGSGTEKPSRDTGLERNLREIVGAGPSQLGVSGALRGRDVNRPSAADLEAAERDVVIVRRHWHAE
jgi:hypothetical protein